MTGLRATEADFSWEVVRASGVDESGGPATRSLSDHGVGHGATTPHAPAVDLAPNLYALPVADARSASLTG